MRDNIFPRANLSTSALSSTTNSPDSACTNGPLTRACWSDGFSISTNYNSTWPVTGRTVSYLLEITNDTISPDGHSRMRALINSQYPGPTLIANWGDMLQITVKNSLKNNGTSLHWLAFFLYPLPPSLQLPRLSEYRQARPSAVAYKPHGWHERFDGMPSASWCDENVCISLYAVRYHVVSQPLLRPILRQRRRNHHNQRPATSNYDYDLGTMTLSDWFYWTAFEVQATLAGGPGPPGDNVLINGTNVHTNGTGSYHRNTLTKGKRYRLH